MKTVILHIGLPKTGTTSLQFMLGLNRKKLQRQGVDCFLGSLSKNRFNHGELTLSVIRDGVTLFGHQKFSFDKLTLRQDTRRRVQRFVSRADANVLLFSAESLSFLRTQDELSNLHSLFPENIRFRIFFVERPPDDWLQSWRKQIFSNPNRSLSSDPNSALYVEDDTWLTDFDQLKDVYYREFGDLTTFRYRREGLLQEIVSEAGVDLPIANNDYRYKTRDGSTSHRPNTLQRAKSRITRSLNEFDYWWKYEIQPDQLFKIAHVAAGDQSIIAVMETRCTDHYVVCYRALFRLGCTFRNTLMVTLKLIIMNWAARGIITGFCTTSLSRLLSQLATRPAGSSSAGATPFESIANQQASVIAGTG